MQAYDSSAADGKGLNNGDYKSDEFDALIDQAAAETDLDKAVSLYRQSERVLLKDLPVIPLWYTNVTAASAKKRGSELQLYGRSRIQHHRQVRFVLA